MKEKISQDFSKVTAVATHTWGGQRVQFKVKKKILIKLYMKAQ